MECELFVEYPAGEVYSYRKTLGNLCISFDEDDLRERRNALQEHGAKSWKELPVAFSEIYRHIAEGPI